MSSWLDIQKKAEQARLQTQLNVEAGLDPTLDPNDYAEAMALKNQQASLDTNQPKYTRPDEINKLMNIAQTQAGSTMLPGEGQLNRNIQNATQSAITNTENLTQSPMASLGAIQDIYKNEIGAYNNLGIQKQQHYDTMQNQYKQALQLGGQYSDQEFEYNVNQPYQRKWSELNADTQSYNQDLARRQGIDQKNSENRQKNTAAYIGAGAKLAGTGVGFLIGGPAGAAVGSQLGSSFATAGDANNDE